MRMLLSHQFLTAFLLRKWRTYVWILGVKENLIHNSLIIDFYTTPWIDIIFLMYQGQI